MEGGGVYDRRKYRRLQYCLHQHPPLLQANENMWRGITQYTRYTKYINVYFSIRFGMINSLNTFIFMVKNF